jgi:hypothetical protein
VQRAQAKAYIYEKRDPPAMPEIPAFLYSIDDFIRLNDATPLRTMQISRYQLDFA